MVDDIRGQVESEPGIKRITFDSDKLDHWDSSLLTFVIKVRDLCKLEKIRVNVSGLPKGAQKLLALATAVPEKKGTRSEEVRESFLFRVGQDTIDFFRTAGEMLTFIGEASASLGRFLVGKAHFRRSDLTLTLQECGAQALPIVSLISLLVGLILAFIGAVQLKLFGAEIYVANLVAISMVRVMGAMMAGIIMAGRTGAAFAAQLGTMETNEEIDALKTLGISPMDFLVLPRMLGLTLMMPLLCLYANLMGILGGLIVGMGMLNIGFMQYYNQTKGAVSLTDVGISNVETMLKREGLLKTPNLYDPSNYSLTRYLESALKAYVLYKRDRDYVVKDGQVIIVDEFTGRLMPGRRYSEGLHQAIEAKERVKVQRESMTFATITFQNYFRM